MKWVGLMCWMRCNLKSCVCSWLNRKRFLWKCRYVWWMCRKWCCVLMVNVVLCRSVCRLKLCRFISLKCVLLC